MRRSVPAPYFHPIFLIFQSPPPCPGEMIKIYSPLLKKKRGGVQMASSKTRKTRKTRKSRKTWKFFSKIFKSKFSILAIGQNRNLGNKKTRNNISEIFETSEVSEFSICHFFIFFLIFFLFYKCFFRIFFFYICNFSSTLYKYS